jgi:hypothetical protein
VRESAHHPAAFIVGATNGVMPPTMDRNGDLFVTGDSVGTFGTPGGDTGRTDWILFKMRPSDGNLY